MVSREANQLQSSWCGEQAHHPSIPQVMGGHSSDIRQLWNVELEVWADRKPLLGTATVCQCPVPSTVAPRWVQHSRPHFAMWSGEGHAITQTIYHLRSFIHHFLPRSKFICLFVYFIFNVWFFHLKKIKEFILIWLSLQFYLFLTIYNFMIRN